MHLSDTFIGLIRTSVPLGVGALVSWLVTLGIVLPEGTELQLASGLTAVFAAAYWALATWASKQWPALGWLLGNPSQPTYAPPGATVTVEVTPSMTRDQYRDAAGIE